MALINNIYIHVVNEDVSREVDSTSHPTEQGIDITDTIRTKPTEVRLSGNIVNVGELKSSEIISKLDQLRRNGTLVKYVGRNAISNLQIQSFNTGHPNKIWGGCQFNMVLKEIRIVQKTAYQASALSAQAKTTTEAEIKVGSIVVFKGGKVYTSTDTTKPAATRDRSTCTCTVINDGSLGVHRYHLVSTDGGKVCGWVDEADIESKTKAAKTNTTTYSGTQQVQQGQSEKAEVYHNVKKGDTVWGLVNKTYKGTVSSTIEWVITNNPLCFSRVGDATSLKVGSRLLIGYKEQGYERQGRN